MVGGRQEVRDLAGAEAVGRGWRRPLAASREERGDAARGALEEATALQPGLVDGSLPLLAYPATLQRRHRWRIL
jgi:hypothetical protein